MAGPTFYQLHLLFDKHYDEQVELVDSIAERIQLLGGVSIAMAADVAETTQIERPPRGRETVSVQLSRLLDAHQIVIRQTRKLARRASRVSLRKKEMLNHSLSFRVSMKGVCNSALWTSP